MRIDFATLAIDPSRRPRRLAAVTLDSGAAHSHADSGYNDRRRECREAAAALGVAPCGRPRAKPTCRSRSPPVCATWFSENARVDAMVDALAARDLEAAARLLDARTPACATTTRCRCRRSSARSSAEGGGAAGARMVGGGFGGAVLALLAPGVAVPAGAVPVAPGPRAALV